METAEIVNWKPEACEIPAEVGLCCQVSPGAPEPESLPSHSSRSGGPRATPYSRTMDYGLCTYTSAQEPVQREALKNLCVQRDQLSNFGERLVWKHSLSCWQCLATTSLQNHATYAKTEPIRCNSGPLTGQEGDAV